MKMTCYQYRKSQCGDKTILWSSFLQTGISYTGTMTSLYWILALGYSYGASCLIGSVTLVSSLVQVMAWCQTGRKPLHGLKIKTKEIYNTPMKIAAVLFDIIPSKLGNSGLAFTSNKSSNKKGLWQRYKFNVSSPILCCFLGLLWQNFQISQQPSANPVIAWIKKYPDITFELNTWQNSIYCQKKKRSMN